MKASWTVLETDRDGRPRLRVWRLPRLLYPGAAIWHERGRYTVMYETPRRSGTYTSSGIGDRSLRRVLATLQGTA